MLLVGQIPALVLELLVLLDVALEDVLDQVEERTVVVHRFVVGVCVAALVGVFQGLSVLFRQ